MANFGAAIFSAQTFHLSCS